MNQTIAVELKLTGLGAYEGQLKSAGATTRSFGQQVDGIGGQLTKSQHVLSAFGSSAQDMGSKLESAGKSMTIGVTAPLALIGTKGLQTAADFQKSMQTMAAVAGVPGPEIEKLREQAIKLGADTVFSANEAAQAQVELSKAGIDTADILGGALANTLDLAAAGDLALADAATIAANAMNTFGLSGEESKQAVDALAGAANASSADVSDLALALAQSGMVAHSYGLSIQETTAALAAMADAGIKGSDAGTSLKTMLMNLQPVTNKQKSTMRELGIEFVNADGSFKSLSEIAGILQDKLGGLTEAERNMALEVMFGSDAIRAGNVLMKEGSEGIENYIRQTSEVGTAWEVAKAKMEGLPGAIEKLKGSMETGLLKIGEAIAPTFMKAAEVIGFAIDAFVALPEPVQAVAVHIGLLAAAIGPALLVTGKLMQLWGAAGQTINTMVLAYMRLTAGTQAATTATAALSATLKAIPAVTAIAALTWAWGEYRKAVDEGNKAGEKLGLGIIRNTDNPKQAIRELNDELGKQKQKLKEAELEWWQFYGLADAKEEGKIRGNIEAINRLIGEQKDKVKENKEAKQEATDAYVLNLGSEEAAVTAAAGKSAEAIQQLSEEALKTQEDIRKTFMEFGDVLAHFSGQASISGAEIKKFYTDTINEANAFMSNLQVAMERGLDPAVMMRLLAAGPEAAGPLVQAMVGENSANIIKMVNDGEAAIAKMSTRAVEMARLMQVATSAASNDFSKNLPAAIKISALEMEGLPIQAIAQKMGISLAEAERIARQFGINFGQVMDEAGRKADDLGEKQPTPKIKADDRDLNEKIRTGHREMERLDAQTPTPHLKANDLDLQHKIRAGHVGLWDLDRSSATPRIHGHNQGLIDTANDTHRRMAEVDRIAVTADIYANGSQASAEASRIIGILNSISTRTWTAHIRADSTAGFGRTHSGGYIFHKGGQVPRLHTGGDEGIKSDEVLSILQRGEYVIRKQAVQSLGRPVLDALNRSHMARPAMPWANARPASGGSTGSAEQMAALAAALKNRGGDTTNVTVIAKVIPDLRLKDMGVKRFLDDVERGLQERKVKAK